MPKDGINLLWGYVIISPGLCKTKHSKKCWLWIETGCVTRWLCEKYRKNGAQGRICVDTNRYHEKFLERRSSV